MMEKIERIHKTRTKNPGLLRTDDRTQNHEGNNQHLQEKVTKMWTKHTQIIL